MPKLNVTADQLELKTNKVFADIPDSSWTDEQYPTAKSLYTAYSELANRISDLVIAQQSSSNSASFVFTDGTLYINTN